MQQVFQDIFSAVTEEELSEHTHQLVYAYDTCLPPLYAFQVTFPRLEWVLSGNYQNVLCDSHGDKIEHRLTTGQFLFVPANCWNKPLWQEDVCVLSLLFGRRQLGLSLVNWSQQQQNFIDVQKYSYPLSAKSPVHSMLQALSDLQQSELEAPRSLQLQLMTVLTFTQELLRQPLPDKYQRAHSVFQRICIYVQENFHKAINRDSVADRFNISPNHLSRLFRQQGHMNFADYMVYVRIDRAKFMLRRYPMHLEEIAHRCGFRDTNYFCRVFKKKTGRTPTEYRLEK